MNNNNEFKVREFIKNIMDNMIGENKSGGIATPEGTVEEENSFNEGDSVAAFFLNPDGNIMNLGKINFTRNNNGNGGNIAAPPAEGPPIVYIPPGPVPQPLIHYPPGSVGGGSGGLTVPTTPSPPNNGDDYNCCGSTRDGYY
ncbi:hypothetical protein [Halotalea alkalilenta]|uniref:hypothetical protein n=1 Tax=Halotalea alkalilenta TaxID=376489 RepID=UPI0012DD12F5|nr:hypothetical protein [Halotalea alkalilenta]